MVKKTHKGTEILSCRLGKACVPGMVTSGYAFMFLSIFPIFSLELSGYIAAGGLFLFGLFLAVTTCGVDIDITNKRVYYYWAYFNLFKHGRWVSADNFYYVSVLIFNREHVIHSRSNRFTNFMQKSYEVYLLDRTKLNRQIVGSFKHAKSAIDYAKKVAQHLGKNYIAYLPDKDWEAS